MIRSLKWTAAGLCMAGMLTFLYIKTQAVDIALYNRITGNLSSIKQVDATLNQDILKSRNELLLNHDPLVNGIMQLKRLNRGIKEAPYMLNSNGTEVAQELASIDELIKQKGIWLEEFKSENAILRNSLHYIPILSDEIIISLIGSGVEIPLINAISDYHGDTLSYSISGDDLYVAHVISHAEHLKQTRDEYPVIDRDNIDLMIEHASMIVGKKASVDNLLARLVAMPLATHIDNLSRMYNLAHEQNTKRADIYRSYLYLYAVILLMLIVYIMNRLRKNAMQLKKTVADLDFQKFALDQHAIVAIADVKGKIIYANEKFSEISGYSNNEIIGQNHLAIHTGYHPREYLEEVRDAISQGKVWQGEIRNTKKNGEKYWVHTTVVPFMDDHGKPYQYVSIHTDITERKKAEDAVLQEKERAQVTLQSIGDGVITTDSQGAIQFMNPVAEQLTGRKNIEANGLPLPKVFRLVDEVTRKRINDPIKACMDEERIIILATPVMLIRNDGTEFSVEITAAPMYDSAPKVIGAVLICRDVTEMRGMALEMSYQATHDSLTGLINRHEFERRLDQLIKTAREYGHQHALCYMDLDQFKVVNDTSGHTAGDQLLRQLAMLLQGKVRDRDTLARLGGDEFGVLIGECSLEQAKHIAQDICDTIRDFRFVWQEKTFEIGVSIGMVVINADSEGLTNVLSAADEACYAAKDKGRNRVHVFQPDDAELQQRHGEMQWVPRIARALTEDRFSLYCQAISKTRDSQEQCGHYEVLIRLIDEMGEVALPSSFIPAAERYSLMPTIDRWVIRKAFSTYKDAYGKNIRALDVWAINLSGESLNDDKFLGFIHEQFGVYDIPPRAICFEITETAAIANLAKAIQFIKELKGMGCYFALDDFGSGLSSFKYLKNLPVDYLKIDGSFIRDIAKDPIHYAMVESINQIGHVMGIQTIAECVETNAILDKIKQIGVDFAQGFAIDRPKPVADHLAKGANRLRLIK